MPATRFLDNINSPADIKGLSYDELAVLCSEIRERLIGVTSINGGHLASNLGVVELTVALHRVFDSPKDQIVFDVGHQCYTHKLLTGRINEFETLRTKGGLSGFPKPSESEHDPVICGHSSTSISVCCGLANAKKLKGDDHFVIAVIGDGAFTGGMAYEGLNNAGRGLNRLIIILNDNKMSINKNVGAVARYLAVTRSKHSYVKFKNRVAKISGSIPVVGKKLRSAMFKSKSALKSAIYKSTLFEDMGFTYLGPVDGHNQKLLEQTLSIAKTLNRPVLIHACTHKGRGFSYAEQQPRVFHGVGGFDKDTGEFKTSAISYSDVFGKALCSIAAKDETVCAITAAMKSGTGLEDFSQQYNKRFFDCGIAEQHAVTFCGGLAAGGMKPVFAVYSSFIQRSFDQVIHDVAIGGLNVTLAIDRAGIVGEDGETHQGIFDCAMFNAVPKTTIYTPALFSELEFFLEKSVNESGLSVIRYPRGGECKISDKFEPSFQPYDLLGKRGSSALLVTYGRLSENVFDACSKLNNMGISCSLLKLNRVRPIDDRCYDIAMESKLVYFFEEGIEEGGICESFSAGLHKREFCGKYHIRAIRDSFVPHAKTAQSFEMLGFDSDAIVSAVKKEINFNE